MGPWENLWKRVSEQPHQQRHDLPKLDKKLGLDALESKLSTRCAALTEAP